MCSDCWTTEAIDGKHALFHDVAWLYPANQREREKKHIKKLETWKVWVDESSLVFSACYGIHGPQKWMVIYLLENREGDFSTRPD